MKDFLDMDTCAPMELDTASYAGDDLDDDVADIPGAADDADYDNHLPMDAITLYLRDIGKYRLLSAADELSCARLARQGDAWARNQMIQCNLRLVVKLARRYIHSGMPLLDLIEEGNLGLMHAVEKFDPEFGYRFSTYATWWIRQAIERGIMNQARLVRLPVHVAKQVNKCRRIAKDLSHTLDHEPGAEEIAAQLHKSTSKVEQLLVYNERTASTDANIGIDAHFSLLDTMRDDNHSDPAEPLEFDDLRAKAAECLARLGDNDRAVLERRFGMHRGDEATLEQIGADLGMSRERVRQIQISALAQLAQVLADVGITREALVS